MLPRCTLPLSHLLLLVSTLLVSALSIADTPAERLAPTLDEQLKIKVRSDDAETLYSITKGELKADGQWQRSVYISIRVNDVASARDYGRIAIPYNHYYSDLTLDFANTITAAGKKTSLADDAMQQRVTGGGQDFYSDSSELVFSLPDISPGSILEFQYTRSSKILPMASLYADRSTPYWFQSSVGGDGWRADYVHHYEYALTVPADTELAMEAFAGFPDSPKVTSRDNAKHYTWSMEHIPQVKSEGWMPLARTFIPTLHYSTLTDWSAVDAWTWGNVADKLADSDAVKKAVRSLELPAKPTRDDKLRAVYGYLQNNVRYVFAHLGRGGYEPHFPDEVLDVSYGDCKDQTVLAVAMLRALGVEAYPALIETPRAGNSDTRTVSLIFDHMIVHAPAEREGQIAWLDTTGDRSLFPGMSNYLAGQNTLIVNGRGGELTRMPELGANAATLNIDYHTREDGGSIAEVRIDMQGSVEQNVRNWWIHSTDRDNALQQYLSTLFNNYESLTADVVNSENLWQPAYLNARFEFAPDEDPIPTYGASITQIMRLFTSIGNLPLPETRKSRFYDIYPLELDMQVRVHGQEGYLPALIHSLDPHESPYLSIRYNTEAKDGDFLIQAHYRKPALDLSLEQYRSYYELIQTLNNENVWLVKLLDDQAQQLDQKLALTGHKIGTQNAEYFIAQARTLIEKGQFSEALEPARKAVSMQEGSGEAWYVLGMVQGFNALVEESTRSFEVAEQLGYIP